MAKNKRPDFSDLLDKLPPIISRDSIELLTGGLLTQSYMEKLDSRGEGPKRFRSGRKVAYRTTDLVPWLENRSQELL